MFDKMKAFMDLQKKTQELKRELENTDFEVQSPDGMVKITMSGSQEVKDVRFLVSLKDEQKNELERAVKEVYNKAIKRSHDIAASKMKEITGLNLPGLT
ncbi:MAG: YbaB/EbfC family nucleoid-associated protein [Candidatus Omnitrophica bacterium]|nr:YbaB/EbfC family nucleoid-associated protein [Candidatus Omnitrophota bacterium]MDD5553554.1 YbaB/EbfC family nucleoid-associated protein [Candidatus Omnitrophota bacterium]